MAARVFVPCVLASLPPQQHLVTYNSMAHTRHGMCCACAAQSACHTRFLETYMTCCCRFVTISTGKGSKQQVSTAWPCLGPTAGKATEMSPLGLPIKSAVCLQITIYVYATVTKQHLQVRFELWLKSQRVLNLSPQYKDGAEHLYERPMDLCTQN